MCILITITYLLTYLLWKIIFVTRNGRVETIFKSKPLLLKKVLWNLCFYYGLPIYFLTLYQKIPQCALHVGMYEMNGKSSVFLLLGISCMYAIHTRCCQWSVYILGYRKRVGQFRCIIQNKNVEKFTNSFQFGKLYRHSLFTHAQCTVHVCFLCYLDSINLCMYLPSSHLCLNEIIFYSF